MSKPKRFKVGNAAQIFSILRDKMYANPITTIVREISCNARDANREVGNTLPIEIKLPTVLSPTWECRDYGPGVNDDRMDIFRSYGDSTKRETNDLTGGFGLGCKTPFSYTDTWIIVTYIDGIKRTYNAYIDESNEGEVALADESTTAEVNGTKIIVPVKEHDIDRFIDATLSELRWWEIKPTITNPEESKFNMAVWGPIDTNFSGNQWDMFRTRDTEGSYYYRMNENNMHLRYANESAVFAIIDGIQFHIDHKEVNEEISGLVGNLVKAYNRVHLYFNNGVLNIASNRENLQYDERTISILKDRVKKVAEEISNSISDQIKSATSYFDACKVACKITNNLLGSGNLNTLNSLHSFDIKWRGVDVRTSFSINQADGVGETARSHAVTRDTESVTKRITRSYHYDHKIHFFDADGNKKIHKDVIYNDKYKQMPTPLLHQLMDELGSDKIVVIETPSFEQLKKDNHHSLRGLRGEEPKIKSADDLKYNINLLDLADIRRVSSIKPNPKYKKKTKDKGTIPAYKLAYDGSSINWSIENMPNDEGGVYVIVDKEEGIKTDFGTLDLDSYRFSVDTINGFLGQQVYGFTPTRAKKLSDEWIPLQKALKNKLSSMELPDKKKASGYVAGSYYWAEHRFNHTNLDNLKRELGEDHDLVKYYIKSREQKKFIKEHKTILYIAALLGESGWPSIRKILFVGSSYEKSRNADKTNMCKTYNAIVEKYYWLNKTKTIDDMMIRFIKDIDRLNSEKIENAA